MTALSKFPREVPDYGYNGPKFESILCAGGSGWWFMIEVRHENGEDILRWRCPSVEQVSDVLGVVMDAIEHCNMKYAVARLSALGIDLTHEVEDLDDVYGCHI